MKKLTSVVLSVLMVISMLSCLFTGSVSAAAGTGSTGPTNMITNGDFESYDGINNANNNSTIPALAWRSIVTSFPTDKTNGQWYRSTGGHSSSTSPDLNAEKVQLTADELKTTYPTYFGANNQWVVEPGNNENHVLRIVQDCYTQIDEPKDGGKYTLTFKFRLPSAETSLTSIDLSCISPVINEANGQSKQNELRYPFNITSAKIVDDGTTAPVASCTIGKGDAKIGSADQGYDYQYLLITFNNANSNDWYTVKVTFTTEAATHDNAQRMTYTKDGNTYTSPIALKLSYGPYSNPGNVTSSIADSAHTKTALYLDDFTMYENVNCFGDAEFLDVNGKVLPNEQAYVSMKTTVDGKDTSEIYEGQTVKTTVDYDKTSGAYSFLGWYDVNDKLYSTTETIEFTAKSGETYTPRFSSTNLLGSSGSFERFTNGTHLRMDQPTTNNPNFPTGYKWGFNVNAGYWGETWAETITYKDGTSAEQISSGKIRTERLGNGTCNVLDDASIAKSGSKFLHINEGVPVSLGIDNLDANTDYELSFYLRYKSTTNKIKAIALTTTVNISNATLDKTSFENAVVNPNHKIVFASCDNNQLSKVSTTDWQKISISFNSKNFEKLYLAVVSSGSAGLDYYIDDMVCTKVVKVDVDSYDLRLGTVVKPQSNSFIEGSSVTVEATAFEGNKFDGWYVGDKLVCADGTYTFNVTDNVILTPKFSGNNVVPYEHFANNGLDGTFEKGDVGNWQFYNTKGANLTWCNATVKTDQHYEGSKSLYLYAPYQYSILKLTNLMPHSRYTLSFKFHLPTTYDKNGVVTNTNGKITLVAITTADAINPNDKSKTISKTSSDIVCTGDWQKFELSFISNNDTELNLMLKVDTPSDGPMLSIDNLKLMVDKEVSHYYAASCDRYCTFCGKTRDINVEHTYSNVCDTTCNVCGNTRTVGAHVYDNACDATCNICGAKRTVSNHEYSSNCDTLCDICGAERTVSAAHTYDNACDDTCNVCYTKRVVGAHVYDDACDTTCNICGATREVGAHVYDNACDTTCNICGAIRVVGAHVYDNACDTTCNICGATRETKHVYDNACDTDCNICGATRETKHVYDNACDTSCNICGAIRVVGDHVYDNACDTDCNECGVTRIVGAHIYDNACDTDCNICGAKRTVGDHIYYGACDSICKICGNERKDTAAHTYTNACDKSCNVCGATRTVGDHVYDNACDTDCNECGVTREVDPHVYDNACDTTCNICGAKRTITHSYKTTTTKATLTKNGSVVKKCSVCGNVASTSTIYYPKTVKIAATTYTYTGKVITPAITVKASNGKALKKGTDYTVTYVTGRKNVGKYRVTVTFKGNYTGTKNFYFTINPVKTTLGKLTAGKKSIKVAITKKSTQVTGYQIQYSTSKTFKSAKTKTVSSYKTTSTTLTKLAAKTTYYVRVRTYKIANGNKYYSGWSTYKYTKTK